MYSKSYSVNFELQPMKITELKIEGYRGFKDEISINLHPNVNVLVGKNGSGKTTILDAIAALAKVCLIEVAQESRTPLKNAIERDDIHFNSEQAKLLFKLEMTRESLNYKISRGKTDKKCSIKKIETNASSSLPILVYYPTNRLFIDKKVFKNSRKKKFKIPTIQELFDAIDNKINSFHEFESWFIDLENSENRKRIRENPNWREPELAVVRHVIQLFFEGLHVEHKYEGPFVEEVGKELKLYLKKGDTNLRLDKFSDGEKTLLLLVSDIARRIYTSYQYVKPRETILASTPDTLNFPGVSLFESFSRNRGIVLIDELELHLHPAWQRKVIPALTKVFPNVQFIMTTHSPQVLSSLERENIHVIEEFKIVKEIPSIFGADSNTILWELFGVKRRPEHSAKAFSKFYKSLENGEDQALLVLNDLEEIYGRDHLEVKKARKDFEFEFEKFDEK